MKVSPPVARVSVVPGTELIVPVGLPGQDGAVGSNALSGGSSFTAPGATEVLHQQGSGFGNSVLISWGVD